MDAIVPPRLTPQDRYSFVNEKNKVLCTCGSRCTAGAGNTRRTAHWTGHSSTCVSIYNLVRSKFTRMAFWFEDYECIRFQSIKMRGASVISLLAALAIAGCGCAVEGEFSSTVRLYTSIDSSIWKPNLLLWSACAAAAALPPRSEASRAEAPPAADGEAAADIQGMHRLKLTGHAAPTQC